MNLKNKKHQEEQVYKNSQNTYKEISEKKTSKLGYILLIIMVAFIIGVSETVFSDLKKIPQKPIPPSYCIASAATHPENVRYLNCPGYGGFNEVDKSFGLDREFNNIKPQLQKIDLLNRDIESNKRDIRNSETRLKKLNNDYNLGLQEKIAGESAIMNKDKIKDQIITVQSNINNLNHKNIYLENQRKIAISQVTDLGKPLKQSYTEAQNYYQTKKAGYAFKVFLLAFIFVLPFFAFSIYYYLKLKRKDSPYTIILTAMATAFSILFLQVVGIFLYDILLREILARIFSFFWELPFLHYVIYYGFVILIIGLFGGIVYYIQKKVFDPVRIAVRRLKDKKCPKCAFPLDSHYNFCPDCGLQLKEKCENCGKMKIRYLSHCPNCGKE